MSTIDTSKWWDTAVRSGRPRTRSVPLLLLTGVPALGAAALAMSVGSPPTTIEREAIGLSSAMPSGIRDLLGLMALGPLLFLAVAAAIVLAARSRRAVLVAVGAALVGIGAAAFLAIRGPGPDEAWRWSIDAAGAWAPGAWVIAPAAALLAMSRHLNGALGEAARVTPAVALIASALSTSSTPTGAIAAAGVVWAIAAAASFVLPAPETAPDPDELARTLVGAGIDVGPLEAETPVAAACHRFVGSDPDGPVTVEVRREEAGLVRLASSAIRQLWFRHVGEPVLVGNIRQARHDALTTLLAASAGVRTDTVLRIMRVPGGGVAIVSRPAAGSRPAHPSEGTVALGERIWPLLDRLHKAGIRHGRIDEDHVLDDGTDLALIGFEGGGECDEATRAIDRAQALLLSARFDGIERAVAAASEHLGDDLPGVVAYLQPATLTGPQQAAIASEDIDLGALRTAAAAAAEVAEPELVEIRRVKVLTAIQLLLLPVALMGLWSVAAEIDFALMRSEVARASLTLIVLGVLLAQLPRLAQAISSLGASPVPIPIGPLYALQLAIGYINVVVPGGAARVAINVRFYQRHGLPAGSALAVGALDGLSGLIVQATMVPLILLAGVASLDLDMDLSLPGNPTRLILGVAVLALVLGAILAVFAGLRRRIFGWATDALAQAGDVVKGLWAPRRLGLLVGGNLLSDLGFALALCTLTHAMGDPVPLVETFLITTAVAVLAWVIPVPGGIGVSEAGLVAGLVGAGMADEKAFAAMVIYRLSVFYLPPLWGFVSLRWLERHRYV